MGLTIVFISNIFLDNLLNKMKNNAVKYKEIIKYPKIYRDLSLLIDKSTTFDEIKNIAKKIAGNLLQNTYLFDIYTDKKMDANNKSYAVRFEFQHKKKTLKDREIDKIMSKINKLLNQQLNAKLR